MTENQARIPRRENDTVDEERWEILEQLEDWLETPMVVAGLAWLVLLIVELIWGLTPLLDTLGTVIWILFILDFALRFILAPRKLGYLRKNWLTALSLMVPALRVFRLVRFARVLRAARTVRGLRLFRVVSSVNRGMRALGASMGRRGFGYVLALTLLVMLAGSAGILAFERDVQDPRGIHDFGEALWWTTMLLTTIASEYWPQTAEGRLLTIFLSLYALAILGYITASLATYFVGRDAANEQAELASAASIRELREEIALLRQELRLRDQT